MSAAVQLERRYTYQEWSELDLGEHVRSELIDGYIYMMATPTRRHQGVLGNMFLQLGSYLRGKKCRVYVSPIAVRLAEDTEVQPDLIVICNPNKLTKSGCAGAPDLVVEILSPSTSRYDRHTKFALYQQARVPEYWLVDPADNILTVHRLIENGYITTTFAETDTATVAALPGFEMDLSAVFEDE